jgi:hypothetical protein
MSGTAWLRGLTLLIALAVSACATTTPAPLTSESLVDSMRMAPRPSVTSCAAAGMALYCASSTYSRASHAVADGACNCAPRNELTMGGTRR